MHRRPERALLHGPWIDADVEPIGPDDTDLADLRAEYGARWRIWRAMGPSRIPGQWCARRAAESSALCGLSAPTAHQLRVALQEAER